MRKIIIGILIALVVSTIAFKGVRPSAYTPIRFFDNTGEITNTYVQDLKVWLGTVTPTTGNGGTINISSAGFTEIKSIILTPMFNTADPMSIPDIALKSVTNTQITYNIKTGNQTIVSLLGATVASNIFPASTTGMSIYVRVTGK